MPGSSATVTNTAAVSLRCLAEKCGARYSIRDTANACAACGNLLDVHYEWPAWDPETLKQTWLERKMSRYPLDLSGVWRFREIIPFLGHERFPVITLREGNTPLIESRKERLRYGGIKTHCSSSTKVSIPPALSKTTA